MYVLCKIFVFNYHLFKMGDLILIKFYMIKYDRY